MVVYFASKFLPYEKCREEKNILWVALVFLNVLTIFPIINMLKKTIIFDALFTAGITVGGLGLVAYYAKSE